MLVRKAGPQDLENVLHLAAMREPPHLPLRGVSAADRQKARLERCRHYLCSQDPSLHVFVAGQSPVGYMLVATGLREPIVEEEQAVVYDFFVEEEHLLGPLLHATMDALAAADYQALLVDFPLHDSEEAALASFGFIVDLFRIAKRFTTADIEMPSGTQAYQMRAARPNDQLFFGYLSTVCGPHTMLPGRGDSGAVMQRYLNSYLHLPMGGDDVTSLFVAEEKATRLPVGFIIIKTDLREEISGETMGFIHDIAVHPDHWGGNVSHLLMLEAEAWLYRKGIHIMRAHISGTNPRALARAQKTLGYSLEWRRWMKAP